jgi:hypothetical protein
MAARCIKKDMQRACIPSRSKTLHGSEPCQIELLPSYSAGAGSVFQRIGHRYCFIPGRRSHNDRSAPLGQRRGQ